MGGPPWGRYGVKSRTGAGAPAGGAAGASPGGAAARGPRAGRVGPRHLTWRIDCPQSGLHMNNGVRSTWRAFTSGTREGAKPRDKSSATPSQTGVDRPDLVPMVT